jgi:MoxR-like ATPase
VFATQNPIEQEGTYVLPEAQLDRFMFMIHVGYPSADEEVRIVQTTTSDHQARIKPVITQAEIIDFQDLVRRMPVAEHVVRYAVSLVRATRPGQDNPYAAAQKVQWGAGPRASQSLILAAKARAALEGRFAASVSDVQEVARAVLGHRVVVSFDAASEGINTGSVIQDLLAQVATE